MQQKLTLRRDRFRESIRKQQHTHLFKKKRLEMLQASDESGLTHFKSLARMIQEQQGRPLSAQLLTKLMNFSVNSDSQKGFTLVGNYLVDHLKEGSNLAFDFYRDRSSSRCCFAWIVRLMLEADCNHYDWYSEKIDGFLISAHDDAVMYGLNCAVYLIQTQQHQLVLSLRNLEHLVRVLPRHQNPINRKQANSIIIDLLNTNESARQILINCIGVSESLVNILRRDEFNQREACLKAILTIYQKSLFARSDIAIFSELVVLHESDLRSQATISHIFLVFANELELISLCSLLNAGLKNILCYHLDIETLEYGIILNTLKVIEAIFRRLQQGDEGELLLQLKMHLEREFNLSKKLEDLALCSHEPIRLAAEGIFHENYAYDEDDDLLNTQTMLH